MTEWTQEETRAAEMRKIEEAVFAKWCEVMGCGWVQFLGADRKLQARPIMDKRLANIDDPGQLEVRYDATIAPHFSQGECLFELMEAVMQDYEIRLRRTGAGYEAYIDMQPNGEDAFANAPTLAQALVRAIDGIPEEADK